MSRTFVRGLSFGVLIIGGSLSAMQKQKRHHHHRGPRPQVLSAMTMPPSPHGLTAGMYPLMPSPYAYPMPMPAVGGYVPSPMYPSPQPFAYVPGYPMPYGYPMSVAQSMAAQPPRVENRNSFHTFAAQEERDVESMKFGLELILKQHKEAVGALLLQVDAYGNTPFHIAIIKRHFVRAMLLQNALAGDSVRVSALKKSLQHQNWQGDNVLHAALKVLRVTVQHESPANLVTLVDLIKWIAGYVDVSLLDQSDRTPPDTWRSAQQYFLEELVDEPICAPLRPLLGLDSAPVEALAAPAPAAADEVVAASRQSPVAIAAAAPLLEASPISGPTAEATGTKSPAAVVAVAASPVAEPTARPLTPVPLVQRAHSPARSGSPASPFIAAQQQQADPLPFQEAVSDRASSLVIEEKAEAAVLLPSSSPVALAASPAVASTKQEPAERAPNKRRRRRHKPSSERAGKGADVSGAQVGASPTTIVFSPALSLWVAIQAQDKDALATWLKTHKKLLEGEPLYDEEGYTPLYRMLQEGFFEGAEYLVEAVAADLVTQENQDGSSALLWLFDKSMDKTDKSGNKKAKLLFQAWYAQDRFVLDDEFTQRAYEWGLLAKAGEQAGAPAPAPKARKREKQVSTKDGNPTELLFAADATGKVLAVAPTPAPAAGADSSELDFYPAFLSDDVACLQEHDKGVRDIIFKAIGTSSMRITLELKGYDAALLYAFCLGATECFKYLLSKVKDLNRERTCVVGGSLIHFLFDANIIQLSRQTLAFKIPALRNTDISAPEFYSDPKQIEMIHLYFADPRFDVHQRYVFKRGKRLDESDECLTFERGLALLLPHNVAGPTVTKILFPLVEKGADWIGGLDRFMKSYVGSPWVAQATALIDQAVQEHIETRPEIVSNLTLAQVISLQLYGTAEAMYKKSEGAAELSIEDKLVLLPYLLELYKKSGDSGFGWALQFKERVGNFINLFLTWYPLDTLLPHLEDASAKKFEEEVELFLTSQEKIDFIAAAQEDATGMQAGGSVTIIADEQEDEIPFVFQALRDDNVTSLQVHDELVEKVTLRAVSGVLKKPLLDLQGYDAALVYAFALGATDCFKYLLSKIEDLNKERTYHRGGALIHFLLDWAVIKLAWQNLAQTAPALAVPLPSASVFFADPQRLTMIKQLYEHPRFDARREYRFADGCYDSKGNATLAVCSTLERALVLLLEARVEDNVLLELIKFFIIKGDWEMSLLNFIFHHPEETFLSNSLRASLCFDQVVERSITETPERYLDVGYGRVADLIQRRLYRSAQALLLLRGSAIDFPLEKKASSLRILLGRYERLKNDLALVVFKQELEDFIYFFLLRWPLKTWIASLPQKQASELSTKVDTFLSSLQVDTGIDDGVSQASRSAAPDWQIDIIKAAPGTAAAIGRNLEAAGFKCVGQGSVGVDGMLAIPHDVDMSEEGRAQLQAVIKMLEMREGPLRTALGTDDLPLLQKNEHLVADFQHRVTSTSTGETILLLEGYDAVLLEAFMGQAEKCFGYLLTKIKNINEPRAFKQGGALIHLLIDPRLHISLTQRKLTPSSPVELTSRQLEMLRRFCEHAEFDVHRKYKFEGYEEELSIIERVLVLWYNAATPAWIGQLLQIFFEKGLRLDWEFAALEKKALNEKEFTQVAALSLGRMVERAIHDHPEIWRTLALPPHFIDALFKWSLTGAIRALHDLGRFNDAAGVALLMGSSSENNRLLLWLKILGHLDQRIAEGVVEPSCRMVPVGFIKDLLSWLPLEGWIEGAAQQDKDEIIARLATLDGESAGVSESKGVEA